MTGHTDHVITIAVSRSGLYLASAGMDCTVRFWDLGTFECNQVIKKHTRWVKVVRFSLDDRYLATAGLDRKIYIWDTRILVNSKIISHVRCLEGHSDAVLDLAFIPAQNNLVSVSRDSTVRITDFITGHELFVIDLNPSWACCVGVSDDGEFIAVGSFDNSVNIFKSKMGSHCRHLRIFNMGIVSVKFPKDLEYLVVGTSEGLIQQIKL